MKVTRKLITTLVAASVLGGTVTGVMLAGGGTALAVGRGHAVAPRTAAASHDRIVGLTQLINSGTITRAQADAIETAMIDRMSASGMNGSLIRMMLSRGQGLRSMTAVLNQLVMNDTITQAQAEAVAVLMTQRGMVGYGQGNGSTTRGDGMMDNGYGNGSTAGGYGMMGGF